jgi:acyl carrier protein
MVHAAGKRIVTDTITRGVHRILGARERGVALHDDLPLGPNGLGLDSIALVEVVLECEEAFGVTIAPEVLALPNVTIGQLVGQIRGE